MPSNFTPTQPVVRRLRAPLDGPLRIRNTGPRGYDGNVVGVGNRIDPDTREPRNHLGVDLLAAIGSRVYAVADGTIVESGTVGGYGHYLLLRIDSARPDERAIKELTGQTVPDAPLYVFYAHLQAPFVGVGRRVAQGQPIAASGNSGNAAGTPPHLHLEVRDIPGVIVPIGHVQDPLRYLAGPRAVSTGGSGPLPAAAPTATPSPTPSPSPSPSPAPSLRRA